MAASGIKRVYLSLFIIFCLILISCELFISPQSPEGYHLNRPQKNILKKKLAEISGINYVPAQKNILAIADDKGKVYTLDDRGNVLHEREFAETQDYEDVVAVDSSIYVLVSDGTIMEINQGDSAKRYRFPSDEKNDFETLYYDSASKGLVILCKTCAHEKGKKTRTAYRFDLAGRNFDAGIYYTISTQSVSDILKDGKAAFDPSAAIVHPNQKKLYILSSAGNLLVITDLRGKVERAFRLNPDLYPQAEGIAFAPNGDMYISNEAKYGKPSLLKFVYRNTKGNK